mmetsp:Transcript_54074/g.129257  ORF Transcript_54074/g.129257 Transcript_54074/m.129257 type:complete len:279 (-) Transcript_54074:866-1702(-)
MRSWVGPTPSASASGFSGFSGFASSILIVSSVFPSSRTAFTLTSTSCPTWRKAETSSTNSSEISEMCTRPRTACFMTCSSTKAPKGTSSFTTPFSQTSEEMFARAPLAAGSIDSIMRPRLADNTRTFTCCPASKTSSGARPVSSMSDVMTNPRHAIPPLGGCTITYAPYDETACTDPERNWSLPATARKGVRSASISMGLADTTSFPSSVPITRTSSSSPTLTRSFGSATKKSAISDTGNRPVTASALDGQGTSRKTPNGATCSTFASIQVSLPKPAK